MSRVHLFRISLFSLVLSLAFLQSVRAADILVTTTADSGNGTLRQAIQFNNSTAGGNTILFSNTAFGQITLTNPAGELVITKDVTILGPGAKLLAINGNHSSRVLHVTAAATVFIAGLTITNGYTNDLVSGGGIRQDFGSLTVSNCVIAGNATQQFGGGIYLGGGNERLVNCTFIGNTATGSMNSLGGGVTQDSTGSLEVVNCTFAGNLGIGGGGLAVFQGTTYLTNCTISANQAVGYYGGGIYADPGTMIFVRNTIIAGNVADIFGQDCYGTFTSLGFNLIGKANFSTGWGSLGDQVGTTNAPLDPVLNPLTDNGGPTPTMAPQRFSSPAIDEGNASGISTDQRGRTRPFTNDYVASVPFGGDRSDIGAYEISPSTLFVINTNDSGPGSLRQTIPLATPNDVDTVSFASNVVGTITLTSGELLVTNNVNIIGPGADRLTVSANQNSRVFHTTNGSVLIAGLTITKGSNSIVPFSSFGGGIYNEGSAALTVSNCVITGNSARLGGGIANSRTITVINSAIVSNSAFGTGPSSAAGGGIYNLNYAWIQNCTISGNIASGGFAVGGGGVANSSSDPFGMTLYFCTIVSNTIVNGGNLLGGGVFNANGGTSIIDPIDCIIANNFGTTSPDVSGPFQYNSFDLIGKADGSTGLTNGVNFNIVGSSASPLDPRIGPLKYNGGSTPTHALRSDSPALDRGVTQYGGSDQQDQRGAPRDFFLNFVSHSNPTDGSDIGAFELGIPILAIQSAGNNAVLSWPGYYGDFTLQSTTNFAVPNGWTDGGVGTVTGGNFNVTNGPMAGNKFFRLKSY